MNHSIIDMEEDAESQINIVDDVLNMLNPSKRDNTGDDDDDELPLVMDDPIKMWELKPPVGDYVEFNMISGMKTHGNMIRIKEEENLLWEFCKIINQYKRHICSNPTDCDINTIWVYVSFIGFIRNTFSTNAQSYTYYSSYINKPNSERNAMRYASLDFEYCMTLALLSQRYNKRAIKYRDMKRYKESIQDFMICGDILQEASSCCERGENTSKTEDDRIKYTYNNIGYEKWTHVLGGSNIMYARVSLMRCHTQECVVYTLKEAQLSEENNKINPMTISEITTWIYSEYNNICNTLSKIGKNTTNSTMFLYAKIMHLLWKSSTYVTLGKIEFIDVKETADRECAELVMKRFELATLQCMEAKRLFNKKLFHASILSTIQNIEDQAVSNTDEHFNYVKMAMKADWSKTKIKKLDSTEITNVKKTYENISKTMRECLKGKLKIPTNITEIISRFNIKDSTNNIILMGNDDDISRLNNGSNIPSPATTTLQQQNNENKTRVSIMIEKCNKQLVNGMLNSKSSVPNEESLIRYMAMLYTAGILEERGRWLKYMKTEGLHSQKAQQSNDFILTIHPSVTKSIPMQVREYNESAKQTIQYFEQILKDTET